MVHVVRVGWRKASESAMVCRREQNVKPCTCRVRFARSELPRQMRHRHLPMGTCRRCRTVGIDHRPSTMDAQSCGTMVNSSPPLDPTMTSSTALRLMAMLPKSSRAAVVKKQRRNLSTTLSSSRGLQAVSLLPSYLADARSVTKYSPETPEGALQLGVAESQLLPDLLTEALNVPVSLQADAIYYQPTPGRESLRQAMADYTKDMLKLSRDLDPEGMIVGAGCNAVLENLCFCLAEAGDAVLIPTPYYAAFEFDLVARAQLHIQSVHTSAMELPLAEESYYPTRASLDAAYTAAVHSGHPPKILLLSHPVNPLGVCYPPHVILDCIDWCRENQVHLVSDEIYAGSVYDDETFVSALQLAGDELGPYVHWVYSLSKDFALSGTRIGAAYSENLGLRLPMQKLNDLCQLSSATQVWAEGFLNNREWIHSYRARNHERLRERAAALTALLDEFHVPHLTPTAGLFCWIDLSRYLPEEGTIDERERTLYLSLVHDYGLLLTPGRSMRHSSPGFFRCVFTAANDDEFALALERFRKFFL